MQESLEQIKKHRKEKLEKLRELGINPYPYNFQRTHTTTEAAEQIDGLEKNEEKISVAGRLMSIRRMGKASFGHIQDMSGRIQIYVRKDNIGYHGYELFKLLDIGDTIGVQGKIFRTRTGEITVLAESIELLAKSIHPLPIAKIEETDEGKIIHDQFADKELRYRQRYVDLTVNPDVKDVFLKRSCIISSIRSMLENKGFLEVETPILQPLYGGAFARPFTTELHSLKMKQYLRIADELYLKRLIIGGYEGVFEIAKDFRNEGLDRFHNPEFTMLELYVAYEDYKYMMELVEDIFPKLATEILGTTTFNYQGKEINLSTPWKRIQFFRAIEEFSGYSLDNTEENEMRVIAQNLEVEIEKFWGKGKILEEIYDKKVEPFLIQPTFVTDHPLEISPLAKKHRDNPFLVERFEVIIAGKEFANAFSELNDPVDQRQRFDEQMSLRAKGDKEAQVMDEDYIRALEYGLPPTAGIGIGIDRLVMLLTDSPSIRDVLFFPQLRPTE